MIGGEKASIVIGEEKLLTAVWFMLLLLLFITLVLCFYNSVLYSVLLCLPYCFVALFFALKIFLICLKYFTLMP